jgi:hypothetical protein
MSRVKQLKTDHLLLLNIYHLRMTYEVNLLIGHHLLLQRRGGKPEMVRNFGWTVAPIRPV